MAPARVGAGARQALRTRVLPTAAGSLTDKAAARARADLDAVLSGGWADVDLAPVDALATALLRHYNVSRLPEGHSGQLVIERKVYYALASMPSVRTICEIGFNGGHSAALWLHGESDVRGVSVWSVTEDAVRARVSKRVHALFARPSSKTITHTHTHMLPPTPPPSQPCGPGLHV